MKVRFLVLALLVLLSIITYLDRVCISVAGPRIQQELGIPPDRWGWVLGAFILAYGLFEIPSGAMGDRLGQRLVLTRIVLWWSVFTILTGLTIGFYTLLVCRFLFGAGEAGAFPNASGSVSRWFPVAERARALGFVWGASRLGGTLAPLLVVPLMFVIGWRGVFYLFGALGIIWATFWFAWYKDSPRLQKRVTQRELEEIEATSEIAQRMTVPWKKLFSRPKLWLIMAMYWFYVWGSMFYLTWFPEFLMKGRGLTEAEMGVYSALPFLLGAAGNLLGGYLSDRLSARYGLNIGRRGLGGACLFVSGILLLATSMTTGQASAIVLLAVGFGVMDCMLPAAWALCMDVGGQHAGTISGAMNTAGQAGGFVCTVLFGYLVAHTQGSYDLALCIIATMVPISSVLFWCIDPTSQLLPNENLDLDSKVMPCA